MTLTHAIQDSGFSKFLGVDDIESKFNCRIGRAVNITPDRCVDAVCLLKPAIPEFDGTLVVASAAVVLVPDFYQARCAGHHVWIVPVAASAGGGAGTSGMGDDQ